jgi:hypothetical protein
MDCEDGFFPITSVHRLDTKEALHLSDEQVAKLTDDMMRDIARKMADDYCEQLFWDHLPIIAAYVAEREGINLKKEPLDAGTTAPVAPCQPNTEHGGDRKCK